MKIITYETKTNADAKTGLILRELERLVCKFSYLVPNGWRFIIKIQENGKGRPFYHLDAQSDCGGDGCAEARINTLENFIERAATGDESLCDVFDMLRAVEPNLSDQKDKFWLNQIYDLKSLDAFTEDMWLWLCYEAGVAPSYGAIRIPYEDTTVEGENILYERGEFRISFDGATSPEQNLFFVLMIFKELNDAFPRLYPGSQGWLYLNKLKKIPTIRLWLDLMGIDEA